jgi:succinate dehydrogenase / fumarate reductase membrane anchor subunit
MPIFIIQRFSAIALIFFLSLHMIVVHYPPGHLDFSRVLERLADPAWKAIDIAFLVAVLFHALAGTYAVLTDIERVTPLKRILAGVLIILGIIGLAYGTYTILSFQPPASLLAAY